MKKHIVITILNSIFCIIIAFHGLYARDSAPADSTKKNIPEALLKKISLDLKNVPLKNALNEISAKAGIFLNYSENIIPVHHKVQLKLKNEPAIHALYKILEQTNIDFTISKSGQVVLINAGQRKTVQHFTISGFITDAKTGEALTGANIFIPKLKTGCTSNRYGFYSLTIPAGFHIIDYNFIGYTTKESAIYLQQDTTINIELHETALSGETVTVTAKLNSNNMETPEMGTFLFSPQQLTNIPALFGEQDILKTIHLLPGIGQTRDGDSGFYVRGGSPAQNLVLLDEAPVYNAFHLLGFLSVFNSDVIKDVTLIKGAAPPKYGGRLSSVLDIKMNEGNNKEFHGNGGIGLIFSRLSFQGPIIKNKGSYMISGRRTYADLLLNFSSDPDLKDSRLYFYDLNLKTNYVITNNDRLYLSGYLGRDLLQTTDGLKIAWGNRTMTLRWNHIFNNKLFLNSSAIYSNFKYVFNIHEESDENEIEITSQINDYTIKEDFQYFHNTRNTLNFGWHHIYHKFLPGEMHVTGNDNLYIAIGKRDAHESAFYISHAYEASEKLKLDYGFRYSIFSVIGVKDTWEFIKLRDQFLVEFHNDESNRYNGPEPRFTVNSQIDDRSSLRFGYARNYQNIHLLSTSTSGTPLDVWQPSSSRVKPEKADQFSIGYFYNFEENKYEASLEVYQKNIKNVIDYRDGANVIKGTFFESELVIGKGDARGAELFLRKKSGKVTGWLSYTCSRSERLFREINNGQSFPAHYDRTHDLSFVGMYNFHPQWTFSATWVYHSGIPATIQSGTYFIDGHQITAYSKRNAYRYPPYHRLDISVTYTTRKYGSWNFALYNAYGRKNTYSIYFRKNEHNHNITEAVRLALFSYVPSITYNFTF